MALRRACNTLVVAASPAPLGRNVPSGAKLQVRVIPVPVEPVLGLVAVLIQRLLI
jgi:hypothetical protein